MRFVAIDVETANPDLSSICQIGLVVFENGVEVDAWSSLINPETWFHWMNEEIHGISEAQVQGKPTFKEVLPTVSRYMANSIMVSHTSFDRSSINQAINKVGALPVSCQWLDSAKVARRTWEKFAYHGYGLANIADYLHIEFKHHDALEDARAAGQILLAALNTSEKPLEHWISHSQIPIINIYSGSDKKTLSIKGEGNPDGALFGEIVVFTGELTIPRREMAAMSTKVGCDVSPNITKKTTLLVIGTQDTEKLKGKDRSSKQIKAEQLIQEGASIRILTETDFLALLETAI